MRILFLARTLTAGGLEPHMMTLGRGLMQSGCTVAIASDGGIGNHSHGIEWFENAGFQHYKVAFPTPGMPVSSSLRAITSVAGIQAVVSTFRPDLIHIHYRATSIYAKAMQILHGIPFVSTLHLAGIPSDPFHRTVSFWGSRVIAISTEVFEYLTRAFRVSEERIRLIFNGVDDKYFRPPAAHERLTARNELGICPDTKVIAMIARMSPHKAHDVLLDAIATMRTRGKHAVALLAGVSIEGDDTWRHEIERRIRQLDLSQNVRLLGFTDSRAVLWASDVSVLPSRQEGFPLATIEAMLSGVVPIRTPAEGAREQITDGQDGFIVPFDDSTALANRLTDVLYDDSLRSTLCAAALSKARLQFSAATMVEKTLAVYKECCRSSGTAV